MKQCVCIKFIQCFLLWIGMYWSLSFLNCKTCTQYQSVKQSKQTKFSHTSMHWFRDSVTWVIFSHNSFSCCCKLGCVHRPWQNPLAPVGTRADLSFFNHRNLSLLITHNSLSLLSLRMMSSITHGWSQITLRQSQFAKGGATDIKGKAVVPLSLSWLHRSKKLDWLK